ncbi:hypothetical protein AA106555_1450 [Neokomagataea thailandica NBRC 106555]|uniref:Alpha/beta hydrolase n=2 Tax=Neokomagataea TaxID=1223423 RepID=A0A4Y6V424_9PROT|nr:MULTISPECIES: hypothetical protein [Neokomagataea]QDH24693.1 hypothetical protein D5366_05005 [Neokomagataea tanensis]GBR53816.1 hypothetical protein AA106555_1450 [Neokomagataea thailandica NBRC 106555]
MKVDLLFEADNLYVAAHLIGTDDVVVTFNNRGDIGDGGGFWGDRFLEKCGVSAIGICARHANWFPEEEMAAAIQAIHAAIPGKRIITYGISMGGYGALKFSRALGAVRALAFSPQWTINPHHCGHYTYQYTECYDATLRGGEPIKSDDLSGQCFVFLDMREYPDWKHFEYIKDAAQQSPHCSLETVIAPFTWHGTLFQLTSAKHGIASRLIEIARDDAKAHSANFRQLLRESRSTSRHYQETRMYCLAHRSGERVDAGTTALRHSLLKIKTQESRLLRAILSQIDGHTLFGMNGVRAEIAKDHLWSTSNWAMDRILRVLRRHNLKETECIIRECLRDREPDNFGLRMYVANTLADIGFSGRATLDLISYFSKNSPKSNDELHAIRSFFDRINKPELVELLRVEGFV